MESSKRTLGLSKGIYIDRSPQRNLLRLPNFESLMEDEDWDEASVRYLGSKQTARANERERTQSGRMGRGARRKEGELQGRMAMDDEQN